MNEKEYIEDLKINPTELDIQAAMQGELFFKWAKRAIEARKVYDQAKFLLDLAKQELSVAIRKNPEKYGIGRITDKAIDAIIETHAKYRGAYEAMINAKAESGTLDACTNAMEQKKRMIEVLITLHGQEYFAGPSVPRNLCEAWQEAQKGKSEDVINTQKKQVRTRRRKA